MKRKSQQVFVPKELWGSAIVALVRRLLLQLGRHDLARFVALWIVFYAGEGVVLAVGLSFAHHFAAPELVS